MFHSDRLGLGHHLHLRFLTDPLYLVLLKFHLGLWVLGRRMLRLCRMDPLYPVRLKFLKGR